MPDTDAADSIAEAVELWTLGRKMTALLERRLDRELRAALGISVQRYTLVGTLCSHDADLNQQHVAELLGFTKSSVSRHVEAAERAGDLVVLPAPHSRREKLLRLTPSGRALAERGDAVFAAVFAEVAGSAGAGGLAVTVKTLRAMTDVLATSPSIPPVNR
jgi:DNA-binding MarR family transcriptional regulator